MATPSPDLVPSVDIKIPSSTKAPWQIALSLYAPPSPSSATPPVIILGHGIGAIKAAGLQHFASRFARAGYFAVALDYLHWGDSDGVPRHVLSVAQELADFRDVVSWARSNRFPHSTSTTTSSSWDPSRIVVWGTSFGGMHVTALLASDPELTAGIAQCPCVDGLAASLKVPVLTSARLGFWAAVDALQGVVAPGRDPVCVALTPEAGSSRPAMMPGAEAADGKRTLFEDAGTQGMQMIAARSVFSVMGARPASRAKEIRRPWLVVLPEFDNQAPLAAAERAAREAPGGEVLRAKGGHFDIYYGRYGYEENVLGQLEFLKRVLGEGSG